MTIFVLLRGYDLSILILNFVSIWINSLNNKTILTENDFHKNPSFFLWAFFDGLNRIIKYISHNRYNVRYIHVKITWNCNLRIHLDMLISSKLEFIILCIYLSQAVFIGVSKLSITSTTYFRIFSESVESMVWLLSVSA